MKNKYQSFIGGRVGKARIETSKLDSNNKYLGNVLVSIRRTRFDYAQRAAAYSTNEVFNETH